MVKLIEVQNMLIQCQDGVTFLMSEHIVCFELMESADFTVTLFAHTDDNKFSRPFNVARFRDKETAVNCLHQLGSILRGCVTSSYGFEDKDCC